MQNCSNFGICQSAVNLLTLIMIAAFILFCIYQNNLFSVEKEKKCWNNSDIFLAECNNLMIVSGWHVQICSDIVFLLSGNVQLPIHQIQGHNAFGVLHRMSNLGMKLPKQDLEENLGSSFFRNLSNTKLAYLEHRAHLLFCPSNHSKAKRSTTGDYNHVVPTNLLSIKE